MPRASRGPHAPVLFAFTLVGPPPREHGIGTARSRLCHWTALVFAVAAAVVAWPARAFDFGDVIQIAGELAGRPYRPRTATIPDELRKLTFAQFQQIHFKPERNLWHRANIPFEVSFVHLGTAFAEPVTVHELSTDGTRRLVFDPEQFDYGPLKLPPLKAGELGFAGFRVHYPLNDRTRKDEVMVFLGASYFRAVAQGPRAAKP